VKTWLVTIALFFACASQAHAYVYWTDGAAGTIGRANLDGTGVDLDFITGAAAPRGIAVDEDHIYWANATAIGRADLDGSDVDQDFITAAAAGVAVDGSYIYWTSPGAGTIGRASLDGSGVDPDLIAGQNTPTGVGVNHLGIYWSDGAHQIRRANLNGTGAQTVSASGDALGLAVDGSRIVWAVDDPGTPTVFTGNLDPFSNVGVVTQVAARSSGLNDTHFFWTTSGAIGRLNRDGTGLDADFIAAADPQMLALDGGQSGTASPSATTLNFGFETVGGLGAGRTLTVTNTGPGELAIDLARITGSHVDDFLLGRDTCSGARLAVDATCTVSVVFVPDAIGVRAATLTLTSNDPASPLQIALEGTGEDPNPQGSDPFDDDFGFNDEFDDDEESDTPARPRLVTCRIAEVRVDGRSVERRRCRTRRLRGTPNFATPGAAHATLTRGHDVYATGTARRSRVVLDAHRHVRAGRYRLTLRTGNEIIRRVRIRILRTRR
jgi:virginiamycin B lyase